LLPQLSNIAVLQLEAIRELHGHHERRRNTLREQHGEIYDQFENVKTELDLLSEELHNLTEHGVALDANFSKFGYSAHLRTKDDDQDSLSNEDHSSIKHHQDRKAEALKFFKRPVIRQYFHRGLLWRSSKASEVGSFELFVDLLYVGIIGIIGDKAVKDPTGKALLEYSITFLIGWKIWSDLTMIINWFEMNDIFGRVAVLLYLSCLFGFTVNMAYAFDTTYTVMIAFYMAERLYAGCYFLFTAVMVPTIKGTLLYHVLVIIISAALWIASIHIPYPRYLPLIFIALIFDMFGWLTLIWVLRLVRNTKSKFYHKYFDFWPAINIEHRTERNNAFVGLVFGYSVLTILYQNRSSTGINAFFGKGILGLVQAFAFNWIYFEIDHYNLHVHAVRRHWLSSSLWVSAQIPFIMGYVLAAATLSQLVLAHDCADTNPETLGEDYVKRSASSILPGIRWYYCGGLGVALISMSVISLSHIHKRLPNARLMKRPRLFIRCCVAAIIICLPLAHDRLSSLGLITITTCLTVFVLFLDLFGNTCEGDQFWTGGFCPEQKKACRYSARMHVSKRKRREIAEAMKRGEKVDLESMLKRTGTDNSSRTSISLGDDATGHDIWSSGHM
jgi:low temperature requirement protein LtrA